MSFIDPSDVQRAKTLVDVAPLLPGCKSLLHVGEQLREGWQFWPDWFAARGIEHFDLLEIWGPSVARLREIGGWRHIYNADVRDCAQMSAAPCDVVFWWHGPEHILKGDFGVAIDNLVGGWQPKLIILGMPFGRHGNSDMEFANKASYHISTWYPGELRELGWRCVTDGPRDTQSGHITAWKTWSSPK